MEHTPNRAVVRRPSSIYRWGVFDRRVRNQLVISGKGSMSTLSATISEEYTQRYEALLRATNAIGTCCDCDTTADVLLEALREVIPFDYLQLVAFESDTRAVEWHL